MASEMSLRERRKQETREQIQRAARTLIAECGYEGATMRALAEAAGVGLGTIALHFKDKKSLLLSTFYDEIGEASLRAVESVPEDGPLKEKLLHILRGLYVYYGRHTIFLRSVVKEALFATGEWKEKFDAQLVAMVGLVAGMIDAHKESGEVRGDVSSRAVAHVGWSIYLNGLIDGLNSDEFDPEVQAAKIEPLLDALLTGVLSRGGDHA